MKIGVAFSGSGPGAYAAHAFADELARCALPVALYSVTSLAATPCLLWARGHSDAEISEVLELVRRGLSPGCALRRIERMGMLSGGERVPVAVNSADSVTGVSVIYTDHLQSDAWNLRCYPLFENEREALCAAVSPYGKSPSPVREGMRLCDFSARYGCPFFPLRMFGAERILNVSFYGGCTPVQVASDSLCTLTSAHADLHYAVCPPAETDACAWMRSFVQTHVEEIYQKLLF